MAAYGALTSLLLSLDNIRDHNLTLSLCPNQLKSLREQVTFLLHCLQNCSIVEHLETKIRDVASQAEIIIASDMFRNRDTTNDETFIMISGDLKIIREMVTKIAGAAIKKKNIKAPYPTFSSWERYLFAKPNDFLGAQSLEEGATCVDDCLQNGSSMCRNALLYFYRISEDLKIILEAATTIARVTEKDFFEIPDDTFDSFQSYSSELDRGLKYVQQLATCVNHRLQNVSAMYQNPPLNFYSDTTEDGVFSKIFEDLKLIVEEAEMTTIAGGEKATKLPSVASSSRRHHHINDSGKDAIVGMDSDLKKIKKSLVYGSSAFQVLPIVGMGGIGKTTLATMVYKDDHIRRRFDVCAWATVSQQCCFRSVIQDILNSANLRTMLGEGDDGQLGGHLYKSLFGRRYFIVLDDVWDAKIWDDVRRFLPCDDRGSCVLLTTRSSEVARCASSSGPQLQMHFLKEHDSQRLLHTHIFGEEDCPEELKELQDEIAKSCKGLPLALVVIGRVLSKIDKTQDSWRSFTNSLELATTKGDDDGCMEILALSYNHLPHHLRPCFLYMGMFPEDYEVSAAKLIQLWSAEGFLSSDNSESSEELGEEYLVELVERNLILISSWNSQGRNARSMMFYGNYACVKLERKSFFLSSTAKTTFSKETQIRPPGYAFIPVSWKFILTSGTMKSFTTRWYILLYA